MVLYDEVIVENHLNANLETTHKLHAQYFYANYKHINSS